MIRSVSSRCVSRSARLLYPRGAAAPAQTHYYLSRRSDDTSQRSLAHLMDRAMSLRKMVVEREAAASSGANGTATQKSASSSSEQQAMAIFDEIDLNGDGVLCREEFLIAVEKMRHLDLQKMKRALECNDISFNHKASVLGKHVLITNKFDAWKFMGSLPDYQYVSHLCPPVALPPKDPGSPDYTLVLDMDETLLHCSPDADLENARPPDHEFKVTFQGRKHRVYAWLRPQLYDFLEKVSNKFEVVIFTASQACYANQILDIIDPDQRYFHHRLFRDSCIDVDGNTVKDLKVLGRDLSKTMLVDNSPNVFGYHVNNGIPIESWYPDNKTDNELEKLEWFLRHVRSSGDVREGIRQKFQVHELIEQAMLSEEETLEFANPACASAFLD